MKKKLKNFLILMILMFLNVAVIGLFREVKELKAGIFTKGRILYKTSGLKKKDQKKADIDQGTAAEDATDNKVLLHYEFWTADGKRHIGNYYPVSPDNVKSGVNYGAKGIEFIGTLTSGNFIDSGTSTNNATTGVVLVNYEFWTADGKRYTGRYYPISSANVRKGVSFGSNNSLTGTYGSGVFLPQRTGQIAVYGNGDDGTYRKGYTGGYTNADGTWDGATRFTDNGDGTATDNLTGLMWTTNASSEGTKTWNNAIDSANNFSLAGHDDWRLPNRFELESLLNLNESNIAIWLNGIDTPFENVQFSYYWTSTTYAPNTSDAWGVALGNGLVSHLGKDGLYYVWYCRAGQ